MAFLKGLVTKKLSFNEFLWINRIINRKLSNSPSCRSPVNLAYASYESTDGAYGANDHNTAPPPVLIMHGLFGSKNNWNTLAKAIHQRTKRKVIAVDARNHGDSPHSSNMTYHDMAKDVARLLENLRIDSALLVGHSMGGAAMMCAALNYPKIVEKLVVVDMSPIRTSNSLSSMSQIFEAMLSVDIKTGLTLAETRKSIDQQLATSINSDSLRQFLLMNLVEHEPGKYKWRVNLPILAENFAKQIATFPKTPSKIYNGPTLFIGGGNSDYIRRDDHSTIKSLFTHAKFNYIEGAGHWVQSEKPAEFLDIIVNFINQKNDDV